MSNLNRPAICQGKLDESCMRCGKVPTANDLLDPDYGAVPAPAEACTDIGADCEPLSLVEIAGMWLTFFAAVAIVAALAGVVYALAS